jgi:hypothetical protein
VGPYRSTIQRVRLPLKRTARPMALAWGIGGLSQALWLRRSRWSMWRTLQQHFCTTWSRLDEVREVHQYSWSTHGSREGTRRDSQVCQHQSSFTSKIKTPLRDTFTEAHIMRIFLFMHREKFIHQHTLETTTKMGAKCVRGHPLSKKHPFIISMNRWVRSSSEHGVTSLKTKRNSTPYVKFLLIAWISFLKMYPRSTDA